MAYRVGAEHENSYLGDEKGKTKENGMVGLGIWGRFVNAAGAKVTVPAPSTDAGAEWLWVYIRSQAKAIG